MTRPSAADGAIFSMLQRAFGDMPMEAVFSESATVESWLRTEAALAIAQAEVGDLSPERAGAIAHACRLENLDLPALAIPEPVSVGPSSIAGARCAFALPIDENRAGCEQETGREQFLEKRGTANVEGC